MTSGCLQPGEPARPAEAANRGWRRAIRPLAFIIGAMLLAGAIVTVITRGQTITQALQAVGDLPAGERIGLIAILCASVAGNLVLTGCMFSLLMSRYGLVGRLEMLALIASATLLNYLPLRPGVLGRVAYHKTVNGIAVRDSAKVIVQAVLLSGAASAYLASAVLLLRHHSMSLRLAIVAPVALLALAAALSGGSVREVSLAGAARFVDVLTTALRYFAAFALIGAPIDLAGALGFACISVMATLVPLVSNGLGLREWAVGLLAPALAFHHMDLGITADLVNRAAELLVVVMVGVPATLWLTHRAPANRPVTAGHREDMDRA